MKIKIPNTFKYIKYIIITICIVKYQTTNGVNLPTKKLAWIHYYYTVLVNQFEGLIKIGRKVNHRLVTGTNRFIVRATVTGAPTPSQKRHYTEISWTWGWGRRVARSMKRAR